MSQYPAAIVSEADALCARGRGVRLVEVGGQCYVMANVGGVPAPPWDRHDYQILIAVPLAYADAGLDGFYLNIPYSFQGSSHQRIQGPTVAFDERQWQLVSWHYPDDAPWRRGLDNLESHLEHCRGFFLNRGARNAIN